jgi:hypothetical protein
MHNSLFHKLAAGDPQDFRTYYTPLFKIWTGWKALVKSEDSPHKANCTFLMTDEPNATPDPSCDGCMGKFPSVALQFPAPSLSLSADEMSYGMEGKGVITVNEGGWEHADKTNKVIAQGRTPVELNRYLTKITPTARLPYDEGPPPEVKWETNEKGEKVPQFNDGDKKLLHEDYHIDSALRKKIIGAYMDGYADHAIDWLKNHTAGDRSSTPYAEKNGLRAEYFKQCIQTMVKYAALKKAADPSWVTHSPRKDQPPMGWKREESKNPAMGVHWQTRKIPHNRSDARMEPPIKDTPEFAAATDNLLILRGKSHIGEQFVVEFPEAISEVYPEIGDWFVSRLKDWARKNNVYRYFKIKWEDRKHRNKLIVRRDLGEDENSNMVSNPYQIEDRNPVTEVIRIPNEWANRLEPLMASKVAEWVSARSFAVPVKSAEHVAHHLFKAGLLNFEIETDEDTQISYFGFPKDEEAKAAYELVRQIYHLQIDAGKDAWAYWDKPEAQSQSLLSSKQASGPFIDDQWRDILAGEGFNPRTETLRVSLFGEEGERAEAETWRNPNLKGTVIQITHSETGDPLWRCYVDGHFVEEGDDSNQLIALVERISQPEAVTHEKEPNENDRDWLKEMHVLGNKKSNGRQRPDF